MDDGSKDGTLEIMRKLSEQDPKVHYISFSRNFGKEAALYAGLERAKGDYVITMDVDLQDPPYLIPKMIRCIEEENYDSVATRRVTREGEPVIRSFFARQFYKLINKISDSNIVDGARDFRMMKRKMVDAILTMPEYNRFTKGIFGWVGFETKWLEYKNVERVAGETKWSFWKLFRYACEGIMAFFNSTIDGSIIDGCVCMHYCIFISDICNRESCSIWRPRCWMAVISMYYQFFKWYSIVRNGSCWYVSV